MNMKRKKKKKLNKKDAQFLHAFKRAAQRYELDFTKRMKQEIVSQIQSGDAEFIEKQSNRVSLFWVNINDKHCKVVYDKIRKSIVSFLPQESREDYIEHEI